MGPLTRRAAILTAAAAAAGVAQPAWAQYKAAPGDMNLGDPKAPVHVVEYLSLTCPHCAHFHADVFPAFKAKYIDTGRVQLTIRELLTAPAQVAAAGFLMARCNGGRTTSPSSTRCSRASRAGRAVRSSRSSWRSPGSMA